VPTRERVLLLGATGTTGRLTLRHLLALGIPTVVAGRAYDPDDLLDAIGLTAVATADPG